MPPTISRVDLTIARGALAAVSVTTDRGQLVIAGPCSSGPFNEPTPFTTKELLLDTHGHGPAVEAAAYALTYEVNRLLFVRTDTTDGTPGDYGTIDDAEIVGSWEVAADGVVLPADDYEVVVRFMNTGTLGVTGLLYQTSDDGGRKFSGNQALGTATSITLARGGGKYNLTASDDEIVALANELRTDYEAHRVVTGFEAALIALANETKADYNAHIVLEGGVHGAADGTNTTTAANATDVATAITLLNELRTDYEAHRVLTAGGVHGAADTANAIAAPAATNGLTAIALAIDLKSKFNAHRVNDPTVHGVEDTVNAVTSADPVWVHGAADTTNTVSAPAATDLATAITLLNELRTDYEAHRILTTGGVHGAADGTNALTAPAATNGPTAVTLANDLKAKYNAHRILTTGGVHGSQDTTNAVTTANATYGSVLEGDTFSLVTTAPRWSIDELIEAVEAVRDSSLKSGTLEVVGPFETAGEVEALHAAILDMRDKIKFRRAQGHVRARNAGETPSAYKDYVEDIVGNLDCDTVSLTPSVYTPSAVNVGAVHVRPFCFATAPRTAKLREDISANSRTQFGNLVCQIRDTAGQVLPRAVDEFDQELFTPLRVIAPRTWPDKGALVFVGQGVTLAANETDTQYLRVAQVLDAAAEAAYPHMADRLGEGLTPAPDNTLDENERKRIEERISKILFNAFVKTGKAVGARISIPTGQVVVGLPPITLNFKVLVRVKVYADIIEAEVAVDATAQAA